MPREREDFPIARVAALARLRLAPSEETLYHAQLTQILEFVSRVTAAAFDSSAVPAAAERGPVAERLDAVLPSLPVEEALANAPDASGAPRLVRVPKVIG
jgi:aspartyl-tRNA(Asn)/glutamyl-tRNA(Gln) amidotransferase subunit C